MNYNFDQVMDRVGHHATKYDERIKKFGTEDVIPLWIADMDFKVAQPILDAMHAKVSQGIFGYVSRPDAYWDALSNWQKKRHHWEIDKSLLSFSVGVIPAIAALIRQFTKEGEQVLIQTPVYPEFYEVIENASRTVIENRLIEKEQKYFIDFEDFEEKLKQGVKLFILCNPQNPVGRLWTKEELKKMGDLCYAYKVPILSDEIHADLLLWGNHHIPLASISSEICSNTITCTATSKTFNLAGLQAASVIFNNQEEKQKFDVFWHNLEIHRNSCFNLVASIAAYNEGEEWLDQLLTYLEGNMELIRDYCAKHIQKVKPNIPECTYLVWLDCRSLGLNNEELTSFMIHKAKLGLNAGNDFDHSLKGYMRLNAACPRPILEQALKQLRDAVISLES